MNIHNNKFVKALLGHEGARVKAEALRHARAARNAARAAKMLDKMDEERDAALEEEERVAPPYPEGAGMAALSEYGATGEWPAE